MIYLMAKAELSGTLLVVYFFLWEHADELKTFY